MPIRPDRVTLGDYVRLGNGVSLGDYVTLGDGVSLIHGTTFARDCRSAGGADPRMYGGKTMTSRGEYVRYATVRSGSEV